MGRISIGLALICLSAFLGSGAGVIIFSLLVRR